MIIKKWNDTSNAWVELYPKTKASELYASDGTTSIFDGDTKVKAAYLPDFVFGGLRFAVGIAASNSNTDAKIAGLIDGALDNHPTSDNNGDYVAGGLRGVYWIAQETLTITKSSSDTTINGRTYRWDFQGYNEEDSTVDSTLTLESGDWLVINAASGSGTTGSPYIIVFSAVNNTYQSATASARGIVKLGSSAAQTVAANTVTTEASRTYAIQNNGSGQLVVNVPWSDTNTTYSAATSSTLGLIKVGFTSDNSAREYAVQLDGDNEAYVSVPWTDNTFRGIQVGSTTMNGSDTFSLQTGSNISVSAGTSSGGVQQFTISATNTTYTAGEGMTLSGTEFRSTYPLYVGASAPTVATEDEVDNAIWFDL